MGTTTVYYDVLNTTILGTSIPLIISIVSVAWVVGLIIKAMKSTDLV